MSARLISIINIGNVFVVKPKLTLFLGSLLKYRHIINVD